MSDGTRTRDNRDHNPGLYQLSYAHHCRTRAPCEKRLVFIALRASPLCLMRLQMAMQMTTWVHLRAGVRVDVPREGREVYTIAVVRKGPGRIDGQGTESGAPGGIRTPDHRIRNPMLYPTELRARGRRSPQGAQFTALAGFGGPRLDQECPDEAPPTLTSTPSPHPSRSHSACHPDPRSASHSARRVTPGCRPGLR